MLPIMPALCSILNSAYYDNNYAGIFDASLDHMQIARVYKPVKCMHNLKSISAWYVNWSDYVRHYWQSLKILFSHANAFIIEVYIYNK